MHSAEEIAAKVKEIIAERIGGDEDEILPGAVLFADLGCDSMDVLEITMAIEEEYEIEIGDADADKWKTVDDVINYVARRLQ